MSVPLNHRPLPKRQGVLPCRTMYKGPGGRIARRLTAMPASALSVSFVSALGRRAAAPMPQAAGTPLRLIRLRRLSAMTLCRAARRREVSHGDVRRRTGHPGPSSYGLAVIEGEARELLPRESSSTAKAVEIGEHRFSPRLVAQLSRIPQRLSEMLVGRSTSRPPVTPLDAPTWFERRGPSPPRQSSRSAKQRRPIGVTASRGRCPGRRRSCLVRRRVPTVRSPAPAVAPTRRPSRPDSSNTAPTLPCWERGAWTVWTAGKNGTSGVSRRLRWGRQSAKNRCRARTSARNERGHRGQPRARRPRRRAP